MMRKNSSKGRWQNVGKVSKRRSKGLLLSVCIAATVLAPDAVRGATVTERVNLGPKAVQANQDSYWVAISPYGRFVAFQSDATNLVGGDTNTYPDVFVRDRRLDKTERVSVGLGGVPGNGASQIPDISFEGRFVAFYSRATNLVPGDRNAADDIFIRDRVAKVTERVSIATDGSEANAGSQDPKLSKDGRFVAFWSGASNLVAGDTNSRFDVFVRDRAVGTTERVSVSAMGAQSNADSFWPSLSADGNLVAFGSPASTLVPGDTNGRTDIFVRDRAKRTMELISVSTAGDQGNGNSFEGTISADGRYVVFASSATNLVAGDTNGLIDIFVHDRVQHVTTRVNVSSSGKQANGRGYEPRISGDGRYVVFWSDTSNLVAGDTNGTTDVFVRDRMRQTTFRMSVGPNGRQANGGSASAGISATGSFVGFGSGATNLVAGDTNGRYDIFVRPMSP